MENLVPKPLRTYKAHYDRTIHKEELIEAENDEDAKRIAELKCPVGFHVVYAWETSESIVERVMNK